MNKIGIYLSLSLILLLAIGCSKKEAATAPIASQTAGKWIASTMNKADGSLVWLSENDSIVIAFSDTGYVNGRSYGQCGNYFSGRYELISESQMKFSDLNSTEALCPNSAYWELYDLLRNASRYEAGTSLNIYDSRSSACIRLKRFQ